MEDHAGETMMRRYWIIVAGCVLTGPVLLAMTGLFNCFSPGAVRWKADATIPIEARAEVDPQIAVIAARLEARIEKLESTITIGGEHATNTAGRDISTEVESQVARTATRFLGWALILVLVISIGAAGSVVFVYVAAHRVAAVRKVIDAVKGKGCQPGMRTGMLKG